MAALDSPTLARRTEAERLIALARAMLTDPAEEIVTIFLDHAIDALQAVETETCPTS